MGAGQVGFRQDGGKFFAPQAAAVVLLANGVAQQPRHHLNHPVTRGVAPAVVDVLEVINIHHQHRQGPLVAPRARHFSGADFHQLPAIGHAGELVGDGQPAHGFAVAQHGEVGAQNQHGQDAQHGKANQKLPATVPPAGQNAAFVETHHGDKRKAFQSAQAKDALAMVKG